MERGLAPLVPLPWTEAGEAETAPRSRQHSAGRRELAELAKLMGAQARWLVVVAERQYSMHDRADWLDSWSAELVAQADVATGRFARLVAYRAHSSRKTPLGPD